MDSELNPQGQDLVRLDEIILKLSVHDPGSGTANNDSEALLDDLRRYLSVHVNSYDTVVDERVRLLLSDQDINIREENKLELITIFSIIKTIKHIDSLLLELLNVESVRKVNALLCSFFGLFRYHFQLPVDHNNYAFRNFGILLTSSNINVLTPFITFMSRSTLSFAEVNKSETLEKTFCLLLVFHCFNQDLFKFLSQTLANKTNVNDFIHHFSLKPNATKATAVPTLFTLYQRFRMSALLEESTLVVDTKSNNLLNILFYSLFHKQFLLSVISSIQVMHDFFHSPLSGNLFALSNKVFLDPNLSDYLTIFIANDPRNLEALDNIVKASNSSEGDRDVAVFLLLKSCQHYLLNYNLFASPDISLLSYLVEYNNANYASILGISEEQNVCELNITALIPIFEIINQNVKLDYSKEREFLTVFKLSLINLDLNLESIEDFMNLNSLLIDIGSSLSVHALIDTIQTLLCIIINDVKFGHPTFSQIPKDFQDFLGFQFIPPVYRSDMSFENNVDLQSEFFGPMFTSLQELENYSGIVATTSQALLEDCLTIILSVKSKVFRFLKNLNNDTNVLRLPDLFSDDNKIDEYPLHVFKQGISTKIGSFKSCKSLNYKLLNSSISLGIVANLSLLVVGDNYKSLRSCEYMIDNSLSRLLNEFTVDFTLTFLIIYQEFGLLSLFKKIRDLNNENLKMVAASASLLSKIFQVKNTDSKSEINSAIQTSSFEIASEILNKSVISSNLLRQYVELFDDGQSKSFKSLNKFLKSHPSTLKPSKISKGTVILDLTEYKTALAFS
ncbi:hypothetical protein PMKS-002330 [Pichia membranifaciens]|uniref:Uncharacterized protein n=1 Tax=Pichia membranifaciens TaxID=4926 RepID=A0A1Q2YHJ0_9ASCO|nr:hypothetical protein PMKS-002330 [Pichia membranifaciens]